MAFVTRRKISKNLFGIIYKRNKECIDKPNLAAGSELLLFVLFFYIYYIQFGVIKKAFFYFANMQMLSQFRIFALLFKYI